VAGERQVRLDGHPPDLVHLGAGRLAQHLPQSGSGDPRGPDHRGGPDRLGEITGLLHRHRAVVDPYHHLIDARRHAELQQRTRRALSEARREHREQPVARLDEQHPSLPRVDPAKVPWQRVPRQLRDLPCHLDPGRAAAHDHERELGVALVGVSGQLRGLERGEDARAHVESALERLDLERLLAPFLVTEIRVARSRSDDERVVRNRGRTGDARDLVELHLSLLEIEGAGLGHHHAHVRRRLEQRPERIGDLAGRQCPGRDLVGERLEQVKVPPVDQRHIGVGVLQLLRRLQAAEAAADDHDAVSVRCLWTHPETLTRPARANRRDHSGGIQRPPTRIPSSPVRCSPSGGSCAP
jgi:hypothetical protein